MYCFENIMKNTIWLWVDFYWFYVYVRIWDHIKDYKMQLEFNTVTIILLTMLVIGIILAVGKFDYEKDKNLKQK